ncbi:DoxX family protein [Sphingobacterium sp. lm-10]|uniref:DoxX family protein n=1 Tax=Sphingobacterium sp. lm-10 TaxID=2944904 RepID=UPI0020225948|nr:DoxX family protein [Sphingobacterium sp. lm-10]MCL7986345.1 DoxX family protein [Sphingobacterium sp. lm-10]
MISRVFFASPVTNVLVIVRVFVGLWMAWYGKDVFSNIWFEDQVEGWGPYKYGFSNPILTLYFAKVSEIVFGLCLALGLLTRLSCFVLLIMMTIVMGLAYQWQVLPHDQGQVSFLYWLFSFMFLCLGGGKYSLDAILNSQVSE